MPENFSKRSLYETFVCYLDDDAEAAYNAVRLANVAVKKGDEVSLFMLGKGVLFEQNSNEQFNVMEQLQQFDGDFHV